MKLNAQAEQKPIPLNASPYQFTLLATQSVLDDVYIEPEEKLSYQYIMNVLDPNTITMVEIDKRLIPLFEVTDNEIFYRPLFVDDLFINTNFYFGKYIIKGIFLYELKPLKDTPNMIQNAEKIGLKETYDIKNITFLCYVIDTVAEETVIIPGTLLRDPMDKLEGAPNIKLKKAIRRYICNILDFVNNGAEDEIKIVKIVPTKERNEKRMKRGKIPQSTVIHIKPKEKFIKYINEFNKNSKKKASHKYQIRGHFRHFQNKRYSEEIRSKPKWISPYFRGEGIFIKKSYRLDGE